MEPRGCNRWQAVANAVSAKRGRQAKTVAMGCDRLPRGVHGKEGVDGSSPSEGFLIPPAQPSVSFSGLTPTDCFGVHAASTGVHGSNSSAFNASKNSIACSRPSRAVDADHWSAASARPPLAAFENRVRTSDSTYLTVTPLRALGAKRFDPGGARILHQSLVLG